MAFPWTGKRNYFSLFDGEEGFDEANTALCAFAEKVWHAGRDGDLVELKKLAKEFDELQTKYQALGAGDTEPSVHMGEVAEKSVAGDDSIDGNMVYEMFRWGAFSS